MHILQSKHIKLRKKEAEEFLKRLNISKVQLPKIFSTDPGLPEGCEKGDIIKIERISENKMHVYFRIVV